MALNELIERHRLEHVGKRHIHELLEDLDKKQWRSVLAKFDASLAKQQSPSTVLKLEAAPEAGPEAETNLEGNLSTSSSEYVTPEDSLIYFEAGQIKSSGEGPAASDPKQILPPPFARSSKSPEEPKLEITSQHLGPRVAIATKSILHIDTLWKAHWQWFSRNQ